MSRDKRSGSLWSLRCAINACLGAILGAVAFIALCPALTDTSAVAQQQKPAGCDPLPVRKKFDTTPPINIGLLTDELIYYRCTDYDTDVANTLAQARTWVAERAPAVSKAAVVLDIDETSLSNWDEIYHNKFAYIPSGACDLKSTSACGQRAWELSARATALRPTLDLFNFAKGLKDKDGNPIAVYFITGRYEDPFERIATEWNLRKVGYDGWRKLYMRPDSTQDAKFVSTYKTSKRAEIEAEGYTIIANIGDQLSDLVGDAAGDHADKCFKIANPFYFIPGPAVPESGLKCMSR
jgi:acid phosphatase